MFASEDLQSYFNGKAWYTPSIPADQFSQDMLNAVEKYNAEFITAYEAKLENQP